MCIVDIKIKNLVPKMKLASDLYSPNGILLLAKSMEVNDTICKKLLDIFGPNHYVHVDIRDDTKLEKNHVNLSLMTSTILDSPECLKTKSSFYELIKFSIYNRILSKKIIDEMLIGLDFLIDMIFNDESNILIDLTYIKKNNIEIFNHSINVMIFCLAMMKKLNKSNVYKFSVNDYYTLSVAALLHDIGKLQYINQCVYKYVTVDDVENDDKDVMYNHSKVAVELLKDKIQNNYILNSLILHHHNRYDGIVYDGAAPSFLNVKGKELSILQRILYIANFYDNMSFSKTKETIPNDILNILYESKDSLVDGELIEHLNEIIIRYPSGTFILTNDGYLGTITRSGNIYKNDVITKLYIFGSIGVSDNCYNNIGKSRPILESFKIKDCSKNLDDLINRVKINAIYTNSIWKNVISNLNLNKKITIYNIEGGAK